MSARTFTTVVRALANDRMGNDVGLFLRRVGASDDAGRRGHGLHGPGNAGLWRLFGHLPGGQTCLLQAGSAFSADTPGCWDKARCACE